jgi:hypothetical protein
MKVLDAATALPAFHGHQVAALITVGVLAGEARCRMERLVNVAN